MQRWKRHLLLILCVVAGMSLTGCSKFDAEEFVQAYLDLRFQGESDNAARLNKDKTRSELLEDYEAWVFAFDEVYITGEMDMDDQLLKNYLNLTKEIFSSMRYHVAGAKTEDGIYEVTVEVTEADLFSRYVSKIQEVSEDLMTAYQNGEYEGTDDEINEQLQAEYVFLAYYMLEDAYNEMEYGDAKTVTIHVEKDDDGEYQVREDDISQMLVKMFGLDKTQN